MQSKLEQAIRQSWSKETCYPPARTYWNPWESFLGQCRVTSMVVQDIMGGDIKYSYNKNHCWNVLPDGTEMDLTSEQFDKDTVFDDAKIVSRDFLITEEPDMEVQERYDILKEKVQSHLKTGYEQVKESFTELIHRVKNEAEQDDAWRSGWDEQI